MKRTNKFMIFNCCLCLLIMFVLYIIGLKIEDFSSYPNIELNNKSNNLDGFIEIFINNSFIVPLVTLIIAFIPIPYLYMIPTISTVFSLSVAIGIEFAYKLNEGVALLIGILPHGLLEIYIMSIELSIMFVINRYIRKKLVNIIKKEKEKLPNLMNIIATILKYYCLYMLPLTFVCALIEVFITPYWYQLLKGILT